MLDRRGATRHRVPPTQPQSRMSLFIAIEIFRESEREGEGEGGYKVSGISRCCSYVFFSLCSYSPYFLDLILLLAKVIMLCCVVHTYKVYKVYVPFAT